MHGFRALAPRSLSEKEANLRYETLRRKEQLVDVMYRAVEREIMAARRPNVPYLTALEDEVKDRLAPVDKRLQVLVNICDQYACAEREADEARSMLRRNPSKKSKVRRNGKSRTHSEALAKGQSLMADAVAAYHAGRFPSVPAAMKGLAGKSLRPNPFHSTGPFPEDVVFRAIRPDGRFEFVAAFRGGTGSVKRAFHAALFDRDTKVEQSQLDRPTLRRHARHLVDTLGYVVVADKFGLTKARR